MQVANAVKRRRSVCKCSCRKVCDINLTTLGCQSLTLKKVDEARQNKCIRLETSEAGSNDVMDSHEDKRVNLFSAGVPRSP